MKILTNSTTKSRRKRILQPIKTTKVITYRTELDKREHEILHFANPHKIKETPEIIHDHYQDGRAVSYLNILL